MRRIAKKHLYILAGLVLASLMVVGCAADATTEAPPSPPTVADRTMEPTAQAAVPTAEPSRPVPATTDPAAATPVSNENPSAAFAEKRDLLEGKALAYTRELAEDVSPRESATEQELEAAKHLMTRFTELGYSPQFQEFEDKSQTANLTIDVAEGAEADGVETVPITGSVAGNVSGALEFVGLAQAGDVPAGGMDGKIALIERGDITFRDKVERAAGAGAVAAVIFNNRPGGFQGTLGRESEIPAVAISQEAGRRLQELMSADEVEVAVAVEETAVPSRNVIAELPGTGEGVVVVGAHYDTVPGVTGANDNGSGVGVLLSLAGELAGRTLPFTLRFIAFGSEETGLLGSRYYVRELSEEELNQIKAMINLDVVGSGKALRVTGDRWLTSHVLETGNREGVPVTFSQRLRGGSSDHASFRDAWVPVIFFHSDDMSRIHTPEDTLEFINPGLLGDTAALALDLIESLDVLRAGPG